MAKFKKQAGAGSANSKTATNKEEKVGLHKMVSDNSKVSKPSQRKHGVKLPDNFKEKIKPKNKELLQNEDVKEIIKVGSKKVKNSKPNMHANSIAQNREPNKNGTEGNPRLKQKIKADKQVLPVVDFLKEKSKDMKTTEKPKDMKTTEKPKDIKTKKAPKDMKTTENPKDMKTTKNSKDIKTTKKAKDMKTTKKPKEHAFKDEPEKILVMQENEPKSNKYEKLVQNLKLASHNKGQSIKKEKPNDGSALKNIKKYKNNKNAKSMGKRGSKMKGKREIKLKNKTATFGANVSLDGIIPQFDEEKFFDIVKTDNIVKVVEALKKIVSEEVGARKNQIFSDYKYMLDIVCFKIPSCPKRFVKLKLKHPLVTQEDDVCLIVKDLQRGSKFDFEPTIHHYEDLLKEKGVKDIKTIMPFNQIKKEYGSFEMKIKLANLYDYFLCDGAIVGHVVGCLGKPFQKTEHVPHAVRLNTKDIAREIKKALHKTCYRQGQKGTLISIPIGTHKMSAKHVCENILSVISQLKTLYPGGLANMRSIYVKINMKGTTAIPMYISAFCPPESTPVVIGPREQKLQKIRTEVNDILTKFHMTATGDLVEVDAVKTERKRQRELQEQEEQDVEQPLIKKTKVSKAEKRKNKKGESKLNEILDKAVQSKTTKGEHSKILKKEIKKKELKEGSKDSDDSDDELKEEVKAEELSTSELSSSVSSGQASSDEIEEEEDESSDESDDDSEGGASTISGTSSEEEEVEMDAQTNGINDSGDSDDDDDEDEDDDDDSDNSGDSDDDDDEDEDDDDDSDNSS